MEKNEFGLKPEYLKIIVDVLGKNDDVEKAMIYGSRAKGNFADGSDIDIVIIAPKLTFSGYLKIVDELEQLDIPYKIDLAKYELLDESIKEHIDRVGKEIFKKKHKNNTDKQYKNDEIK